MREGLVDGCGGAVASGTCASACSTCPGASGTGDGLEIVPLSAPGADPTVRARVLWNGKPLAGALVKAWRATLGTDAASRDSIGVAWSGRTDTRGEITLSMTQPGDWLLSTVHMVPCPDHSEADWESTWASLTFERAAAQ